MVLDGELAADPQKCCIVGSDGSGSVYLAELHLHWQQRCLHGCPGYRWVQLVHGCLSRTKEMPREALVTRCKHFHPEPSHRKELQE